jgi:hypothetical protein
MAIFSRLILRRCSGACGEASLGDVKEDARRRGVRGETFAYWYLRRHGYVFVARNYVPREVKGKIDLIGYDGERWRSSKFGRGRRPRGSGGAAGVECDCRKTASGGPDCAAISDGAARERVSGAVRCGGDRRVTGSRAAGTAAQERF